MARVLQYKPLLLGKKREKLQGLSREHYKGAAKTGFWPGKCAEWPKTKSELFQWVFFWNSKRYRGKWFGKETGF
jgi:hypothetical protein